ncbi:MAG: hypothetical protein MZV64_23815 [Ignavibacteriales bacterium]|nr:hypothetical protein [Ignavibacteriales bacterium]
MVRVAALQGKLRVYDVDRARPAAAARAGRSRSRASGDDGWTPDYGDGYDFDRAGRAPRWRTSASARARRAATW